MSMKKLLNIKAFLVLALIFMMVGCTKDFEDMNINPNEPNEAPSTNILAYSIRYFADNFFNAWQDMNEPASYAGHISKIQYIDEARYAFREGVVNNAWRDAYNVMNDLQKIIDKSAEDKENTPAMKAAAMTFQMYVLQIATDKWKAVPWSEALQGQDGITNPAYDDQAAVYDAILANLAAASDIFASGADDDLGEGDILFGGDIAKWEKFCNSLRLRAAIRISKVDAAKAQSVFAAVIGKPIMEDNSDNAYLWWPGAAPYKEPFQEDSETRDDHGMCNTLIDYLIEYNDPRLPVMAHPGYFDGNGNPVYLGVAAGAIDGTFDMSQISRIGAMYRDDAAGFTPFMRVAEVYFNLAEAAALGWNVGMSAKDAYEMGVKMSIYENGLGDAEYDAYIAQPIIAWDGSMEKLYMQKWICLFKDGMEAWSESRRTDVPLMGPAEGSPYTGHNRPPFRYPYPTNEVNLNGASITPFLSGIVDDFWGQQMWWDTRTGVQ